MTRMTGWIRCSVIACLIGATGVGAVGADNKDEKIAKYRKLADESSGGWRFGRQHKINYGEEFLTAEHRKEMQKKYLAALAELHKLQPQDAAVCNEYAACLAFNGKADEAIRILKPFADQEDLAPELRIDILMNLAEAFASKDDIKTAMKYAQRIDELDLDIDTRRDPWSANIREAAKLAVFIDDGWDLDALKLPVYTGAKAFPTPQEAEYTDDFVPLKRVKLSLGGGIDENDARVKLLKVKFKRFGIEFDKSAPFDISINEDKLQAPDKSEGYALEVSKDGAVLQGHDKLGTTWAVVSLIQLIDQEKNAVRICKINDWPDVAMRGYGLVSDYRYTLESALFSKIGMVSDQRNVLTQLLEKVPPFRKYLLSKMFEAHIDFGIPYYWGDRGLVPGMPITSPNVRRMLLERWMDVAEAGATGIIGCHEDRGGLVPMQKADLENSGGGDKLHGKFFTGLFREVRKDHPEFQCMMWLPIDYGPDKPPAVTFAEESMNCSREEYLGSLKTDLDPEIVMMFMGNRRGAYTRERLENDWVKGLHGHEIHLSTVRPLAPYGYASLADEIPFGKNFYDGIGDDVQGMSIYLAAPRCAVQYAKFSDSLWNKKAYNMRESARKACEIYLGKGLYEAMKPAAEVFAELNTYYNPRNGRLTPLSVAKTDRIEECVKIAEAALEKAEKINPQTLIIYDDGYMSAANIMLRRTAKAGTNYFHQTYASKIDANKALARKEAGLNEKAGDIFKSPADFLGGTLGNTKAKSKNPLITYFRGADTPFGYIEIPFKTDKAGPHELIVCGMNERDRLRPVTWRVLLNGEKVYEGETGLPDWPDPDGKTVHSTVKIELPAENMAKDNVIRIECTNTGGTVHFSPWIGVNYVVVRRTE